MSMGMIKSGEYVPCGASATLMSQYPMKPTTDIISVTAAQLYNGWTAPCAGVLSVSSQLNGYTIKIFVNGVCLSTNGIGAGGQNTATLILNKGDVTTYTINGDGYIIDETNFRPFAVGEVL